MKNFPQLIAWTGILLLLNCTGAYAADFPANDGKLIKDAGIQIYPEAIFVNGGKDVGFRFATAKPVAEVQAWYSGKMSGWTLFNDYGSWILHDGPAGLGLGQVMSRKQIQVQQNLNLSEWFGLNKSMSTEIVIMTKGL